MRILSRVLTVRTITLVAFETLLIVAAIETAVFIRFGARALEVMIANDSLLKFLLVAGVLQTCLYYADLYDIRTLGDRRELARAPHLHLDRLSREIIAVLEKPAAREAITKMGFSLKVREPAAFRPYLVEEIKTWGEIIKAAGVKAEG